MDELDYGRILSILFYAFVAVVLVIILLWFWNEHALEPYRATCRASTVVRYENASCTTLESCVENCAHRLRSRVSWW